MSEPFGRRQLELDETQYGSGYYVPADRSYRAAAQKLGAAPVCGAIIVPRELYGFEMKGCYFSDMQDGNPHQACPDSAPFSPRQKLLLLLFLACGAWLAGCWVVGQL